MNDLEKLGTFTVNAALSQLQDLQNMNDHMDEIVTLLFGTQDVPREAWESLKKLQMLLDKATKHSMLLPSYIHRIVPETHVPVTHDASET